MKRKSAEITNKLKDIIDENQKNLFFEFLVNFSAEKIEQLEEINAKMAKDRNELKQLTLINKKLTNTLNEKVAKLEKTKENLEYSLDEKTQELVKTEKLASIGELAARLSHDVRNSLSVINGATQIIARNEGLSKREQEHLNRMQKSIKRITHQLDHVLDFVKTVPLNKKNASLLTLLKQSIEEITVPPNIEIIIPKNNLFFNCDEVQIKTLFVNLLINAIQILDNQGKIIIRFISSQKHILLEFEDSGPGIPEENIKTIFEPLFTTKEEGTGLGLVSCKTIVEQHDGEISVKNNPTTFSIFFPSN